MGGKGKVEITGGFFKVEHSFGDQVISAYVIHHFSHGVSPLKPQEQLATSIPNCADHRQNLKCLALSDTGSAKADSAHRLCHPNPSIDDNCPSFVFVCDKFEP
jgi:hypothetical protein